MKKVLFATSALVMTAGYAAAEVTVSGDARLGLRYDSELCSNVECTETDGAWNVVNRARVKFSMEGESNSGLAFGASFRADQAKEAKEGSSAYTGSVYVSGAYGKLTVGDIDSAMANTVGHLYDVGLTGLGDYNEFIYLTSDDDSDINGDAGLLYEYSINGVGVYASFHDSYYGNSAVEVQDNGWSLGAKYDMAGYAFGVGYEKRGDESHYGISAEGQMGMMKVKGAYAHYEIDNTDLTLDQYGVSGQYDMVNGVGVTGFYRHVEADDGTTSTGADFFGVGTSYDVGGGATLKAGVSNASYDGVEDDVVAADFGLSFKF